ncbi:MAG: hypothetical protein ABGX07_02520 [Pirellulaceae bacterium]
MHDHTTSVRNGYLSIDLGHWNHCFKMCAGLIFVTTLWAVIAWSPPTRSAEPALKKWKTSRFDVPQRYYQISGTEDRNNPLLRPLVEPFRGERLFVHFRLRYSAESIDLPSAGDGEFFSSGVCGSFK